MRPPPRANICATSIATWVIAAGNAGRLGGGCALRSIAECPLTRRGLLKVGSWAGSLTRGQMLCCLRRKCIAHLARAATVCKCCRAQACVADAPAWLGPFRCTRFCSAPIGRETKLISELHNNTSLPKYIQLQRLINSDRNKHTPWNPWNPLPPSYAFTKKQN